jgi:hypothetical protein
MDLSKATVMGGDEKIAQYQREQAARRLEQKKEQERPVPHRFKPRRLRSHVSRYQELMQGALRTAEVNVAQLNMERTGINYRVKIDTPDSDYHIVISIVGGRPASAEGKYDQSMIQYTWWNDPKHPSTLDHILGKFAHSDLKIDFSRSGRLPPIPRRHLDRNQFEAGLRRREFISLCNWARDAEEEHEKRLRLFVLGVGRFMHQRPELPPPEFKARLVRTPDKKEDDTMPGVFMNVRSESTDNEETVWTVDALRRPSFNSDYGFHPILLQSATHDNQFHQAGLTEDAPNPKIASFDEVDVWWFRGSRLVCERPEEAWT